jgi:hypothetical protein
MGVDVGAAEGADGVVVGAVLFQLVCVAGRDGERVSAEGGGEVVAAVAWVAEEGDCDDWWCLLVSEGTRARHIVGTKTSCRVTMETFHRHGNGPFGAMLGIVFNLMVTLCMRSAPCEYPTRAKT